MSNLRSKTIRLAASMSPGKSRTALLQVLAEDSSIEPLVYSTVKRLPLSGIIRGYVSEDDMAGRELNMIGPFVDAKKWIQVMSKGLEQSKGTYNYFDVRRVGAMLLKMEQSDPTLTFAPGREGSVVVYISGSRESILAAWPRARRSGADDIDISATPTFRGPFFQPKAGNIPDQAFIRLWWD